jgi:serine/threonine protein kinase
VTGFGGGVAADYLAPEGGPSVLADVYALGAVVWEALAGRPPYLLGDAPRLRDLRPELPEALDEVLRRALAPEERWESAGALARAARLVAR